MFRELIVNWRTIGLYGATLLASVLAGWAISHVG